MSFSMDIKYESDVLLVTLQGTNTKTSGKIKFLDLINVFEKYSANKVLIDLRKLENIIQSSTLAFEYGELFARNRGMIVKTFVDFEKSFRWLKSPIN